VDNLTQAEGWEGGLVDDVVLFSSSWSACSSDMVAFCWFGGKITARPASDTVTFGLPLFSGTATFVLTRGPGRP
jgi:hypothetical protein